LVFTNHFWLLNHFYAFSLKAIVKLGKYIASKFLLLINVVDPDMNGHFHGLIRNVVQKDLNGHILQNKGIIF